MDGKKEQWKCPNGHVLGVVNRKRLDKLHVTVLLEFRMAVNLDDEALIEPDISGVLEGGKTIVCSVCRAERYFSPSAEALERFLAKRKKRREIAR